MEGKAGKIPVFYFLLEQVFSEFCFLASFVCYFGCVSPDDFEYPVFFVCFVNKLILVGKLFIFLMFRNSLDRM